MSGIVGYTGKREAAPILLEGLSSLEYRGYDSAGIAVEEKGEILTYKTRGRLINLAQLLEARGIPRGTCGIGHTRWATHGEPTDQNAHPHGTGQLALVHNGIIENYQELRQMLERQGYTFESDTDTECAAKLIDSFYRGDPEEAIRWGTQQLEGSYAFAILFQDHPGKLYAIRKNSPLIVAQGDGECFVTSDVPAILPHTRRYYLLEEGELAVLSPGKVCFYSPQGLELRKEELRADWSVEQARKGGYPNFMLKEIYEQPKALADTLGPRIVDQLPDFSHDHIEEGWLSRFRKLHLVACGSALHVGLLGKTLIETLARVPVEVSISSEFRYANPILEPDHLVVIISQSGETADSLAAMRLAKVRGVSTLGIVNVAGSTLAREADRVILTYAGPEIAVVTTKAFSVQLGILYLLAIQLAYENGSIQQERAQREILLLDQAVQATECCLGVDSVLQRYASRFALTQNLFCIGRGLDRALAMEGALKLKEIAYIHSEACAAGELKHGAISLVTPGTPVVALITQRELMAKTISNIKEVKSRGADVLLICSDRVEVGPEVYTDRITIPTVPDFYMPLLAVIPMQLLAYHTAVLRGCNVDQPRNLAKSVTVE